MKHTKQPEALPTPYGFEPETASEFAEWMNAQCASWTFKVAHDDSPEGNGKSWVVLYDAQGEFVGYWTFDPEYYCDVMADLGSSRSRCRLG